MKSNKNKINALLLLVIFIAHFSNIHFFPHSHTINGHVIAHSHPYSGTKEIPTHTHTTEQLVTINHISVLLIITAVLIFLEKLVQNSFSIITNTSTRYYKEIKSVFYLLRGPPVC